MKIERAKNLIRNEGQSRQKSRLQKLTMLQTKKRWTKSPEVRLIEEHEEVGESDLGHIRGQIREAALVPALRAGLVRRETTAAMVKTPAPHGGPKEILDEARVAVVTPDRPRGEGEESIRSTA
jgi:hypothetical protein